MRHSFEIQILDVILTFSVSVGFLQYGYDDSGHSRAESARVTR